MGVAAATALAAPREKHLLKLVRQEKSLRSF